MINFLKSLSPSPKSRKAHTLQADSSYKGREDKVVEQIENFNQYYEIFSCKTIQKFLYEQRSNEAFSKDVFAAVMFADISGFTRLSAKLTVEQLKFHINEYFSLLIGVVDKYHGDVIKFCGDAVIIMWPIDLNSHDDVKRAACEISALCALQIIRDCGEYDRDDDGKDISLRLHCGLGCGVIHCMCLGEAERWEFLISGGPLKQVGYACDNASVGEICISQEVFKMVLDRFDCTKLGGDCYKLNHRKHIYGLNTLNSSHIDEYDHSVSHSASSNFISPGIPNRTRSFSVSLESETITRINTPDKISSSPSGLSIKSLSRKHSHVRQFSNACVVPIDDHVNSHLLTKDHESQASQHTSEAYASGKEGKELAINIPSQSYGGNMFSYASSRSSNISNIGISKRDRSFSDGNILMANNGEKQSHGSPYQSYRKTSSSLKNPRLSGSYTNISLGNISLHHGSSGSVVADGNRQRSFNIDDEHTQPTGVTTPPSRHSFTNSNPREDRDKDSMRVRKSFVVVSFDRIGRTTSGNSNDGPGKLFVMDLENDSCMRTVIDYLDMDTFGNVNFEDDVQCEGSKRDDGDDLASLQVLASKELDAQLDSNRAVAIPSPIIVTPFNNEVLSQALKKSNEKQTSFYEIGIRGMVHEAARKVLDTTGSGLAYLAEIREVVTIFIQIVGLDDDFDTGKIRKPQKVIHVILSAMRNHGGSLRQYVVDDKGCVLILAFGLPGSSYKDNARRSIDLVLAIRKVLQGYKISCKMGVASGFVYCGLVGTIRRCEYAMMGSTVNLAARLMGNCKLNDIVVSEEVYAKTSLYFDFITLPKIKAKGFINLVSAYSPKEKPSPAVSSKDTVPRILPPSIFPHHNNRRFIGREKELLLIQFSLEEFFSHQAHHEFHASTPHNNIASSLADTKNGNDVDSSNPNSSSMFCHLITGGHGTGKSMFLSEVYSMVHAEKKFVAVYHISAALISKVNNNIFQGRSGNSPMAGLNSNAANTANNSNSQPNNANTNANGVFKEDSASYGVIQHLFEQIFQVSTKKGSRSKSPHSAHVTPQENLSRNSSIQSGLGKMSKTDTQGAGGDTTTNNRQYANEYMSSIYTWMEFHAHLDTIRVYGIDDSTFELPPAFERRNYSKNEGYIYKFGDVNLSAHNSREPSISMRSHENSGRSVTFKKNSSSTPASPSSHTPLDQQEIQRLLLEDEVKYISDGEKKSRKEPKKSSESKMFIRSRSLDETATLKSEREVYRGMTHLTSDKALSSSSKLDSASTSTQRPAISNRPSSDALFASDRTIKRASSTKSDVQQTPTAQSSPPLTRKFLRNGNVTKKSSISTFDITSRLRLAESSVEESYGSLPMSSDEIVDRSVFVDVPIAMILFLLNDILKTDFPVNPQFGHLTLLQKWLMCDQLIAFIIMKSVCNIHHHCALLIDDIHLCDSYSLEILLYVLEYAPKGCFVFTVDESIGNKHHYNNLNHQSAAACINGVIPLMSSHTRISDYHSELLRSTIFHATSSSGNKVVANMINIIKIHSKNVVTLNPFTIYDISALIKNLINDEYLVNFPNLLSEITLNEILFRTQGIPYVATCLVMSLRESLISGDYDNNLNGLPTGEYAIILSRFDALTGMEQNLLKAASVLNEAFTLEMMELILLSMSHAYGIINVKKLLNKLVKLNLLRVFKASDEGTYVGVDAEFIEYDSDNDDVEIRADSPMMGVSKEESDDDLSSTNIYNNNASEIPKKCLYAISAMEVQTCIYGLMLTQQKESVHSIVGTILEHYYIQNTIANIKLEVIIHHHLNGINNDKKLFYLILAVNLYHTNNYYGNKILNNLQECCRYYDKLLCVFTPPYRTIHDVILHLVSPIRLGESGNAQSRVYNRNSNGNSYIGKLWSNQDTYSTNSTVNEVGALVLLAGTRNRAISKTSTINSRWLHSSYVVNEYPLQWLLLPQLRDTLSEVKPTIAVREMMSTTSYHSNQGSREVLTSGSYVQLAEESKRSARHSSGVQHVQTSSGTNGRAPSREALLKTHHNQELLFHDPSNVEVTIEVYFSWMALMAITKFNLGDIHSCYNLSMISFTGLQIGHFDTSLQSTKHEQYRDALSLSASLTNSKSMCLPCFCATSFFSCFTKKSSLLQLPKFRNKFIYENVLLLTLHLQKICLLRNEMKMLHDLLLFSEEIMKEIFTLFGGALTEDAIVLKQVIESEIVGDDNKQLRKIFFAVISNSLIIRNPNLLVHYLISAYYYYMTNNTREYDFHKKLSYLVCSHFKSSSKYLSGCHNLFLSLIHFNNCLYKNSIKYNKHASLYFTRIGESGDCMKYMSSLLCGYMYIFYGDVQQCMYICQIFLDISISTTSISLTQSALREDTLFQSPYYRGSNGIDKVSGNHLYSNSFPSPSSGTNNSATPTECDYLNLPKKWSFEVLILLLYLSKEYKLCLQSILLYKQYFRVDTLNTFVSILNVLSQLKCLFLNMTNHSVYLYYSHAPSASYLSCTTKEPKDATSSFEKSDSVRFSNSRNSKNYKKTSSDNRGSKTQHHSQRLQSLESTRVLFTMLKTDAAKMLRKEVFNAVTSYTLFLLGYTLFTFVDYLLQLDQERSINGAKDSAQNSGSGLGSSQTMHNKQSQDKNNEYYVTTCIKLCQDILLKIHDTIKMISANNIFYISLKMYYFRMACYIKYHARYHTLFLALFSSSPNTSSFFQSENDVVKREVLSYLLPAERVEAVHNNKFVLYHGCFLGFLYFYEMRALFYDSYIYSESMTAKGSSRSAALGRSREMSFPSLHKRRVVEMKYKVVSTNTESFKKDRIFDSDDEAEGGDVGKKATKYVGLIYESLTFHQRLEGKFHLDIAEEDTEACDGNELAPNREDHKEEEEEEKGEGGGRVITADNACAPPVLMTNPLSAEYADEVVTFSFDAVDNKVDMLTQVDSDVKAAINNHSNTCSNDNNNDNKYKKLSTTSQRESSDSVVAPLPPPFIHWLSSKSFSGIHNMSSKSSGGMMRSNTSKSPSVANTNATSINGFINKRSSIVNSKYLHRLESSVSYQCGGSMVGFEAVVQEDEFEDIFKELEAGENFGDDMRVREISSQLKASLFEGYPLHDTLL